MKNGLKICQREIFNKNFPKKNAMFQEIKKEIESFEFFVVSLDFGR